MTEQEARAWIEDHCEVWADFPDDNSGDLWLAISHPDRGGDVVNIKHFVAQMVSWTIKRPPRADGFNWLTGQIEEIN